MWLHLSRRIKTLSSKTVAIANDDATLAFLVATVASSLHIGKLPVVVIIEEVTKKGINALRRLIGSAAQSISERFVQDPKRKKIVTQVMQEDPVIATAERENPGQALQAYKTMRRFAPTLSSDPNVVTSFLRNSALSGGPMDFQTVRGLADAETSIQRAQNEGAWLRGGF